MKARAPIAGMLVATGIVAIAVLLSATIHSARADGKQSREGASARRTTATGPNGSVGIPTTIVVRVNDANGNPVTASVKVIVKTSGANVAVPMVTAAHNGTYSAVYTPVQAGDDLVAITVGGIAIKGSPFASAVARKSFVFTPPAPSGDAKEFLAALRGAGEQYQSYELADSRSPVNERELAVAIVNDVRKFSRTRDAGPGIVPPISDVSDSTRAQMTSAISGATKRLLTGRFASKDTARLRIVVLLFGDGTTDMGGTALKNSANVSIDIGATPRGGMMSVRMFLVDTKEKRVLWFTDKAWGLGGDEAAASEFAGENIVARLKYLFGLTTTP